MGGGLREKGWEIDRRKDGRKGCLDRTSICLKRLIDSMSVYLKDWYILIDK